MGQLSAREGGHDGDDGGDMMKVSPDNQADKTPLRERLKKI